MTRLTAAGYLRPTTASTAMLVFLNTVPAIAQDTTSFDLGTLVLEWENIGRSIKETSAANSVIASTEAEASKNRDVFDAVNGQPNIITERGAQLPVIRGIDGTAGQFGASQFSSGSNPSSLLRSPWRIAWEVIISVYSSVFRVICRIK